MASADPVSCSCRNNCVRPPGREGQNTRAQCRCFINGTVCTYLCGCGRGKIDCANTIDAHLEEEAALFDDADEEDCDDPSFECDQRPIQLAVFFQGHDGEVTVDSEDVLNTSMQDVASAQAEKDASFMENEDEEINKKAPRKPGKRGAANRKDEGKQKKAPGKARRRRVANDLEDYDSTVEKLKSKVGDLTTDAMETLVLKMIRLHPDLVSMAMEPDPELNQPGAVPFCNCGLCRPMPTLIEQLCCALVPETICILRDEETRGPINQMVLSKRALQVAILNHNEYCVQNDNINDHNCLRHMAYRKFVLWQRGILGPGKRVVIPSCVVWAIRDLYPSEDGTYKGFIPSEVFHDA